MRQATASKWILLSLVQANCTSGVRFNGPLLMQNVNSLDNGMKKKMIDGITKCNHKSLEKQTLE